MLAEVECTLCSGALPGERLCLSPRALVGGLSAIAEVRLLRGEAEELPALRDGLCAWLDAYALAPGEPAWPARWWTGLRRSLPPSPSCSSR